MDRSLAGRAAIGRPFAPPTPRRSRRAARRLPFSRARRRFSFIWRHRRLRTGLLTALIALPALSGGWLWLRDSPLVSVERVQVSGVHGPEAAAIEATLARTAQHMTTLDVRSGVLLSAVAPYRVVREVQAKPNFPHGIKIRVVEQLPVAVLTVPGGKTAVAADGVLLGPALVSGSLPLLGGELSHSAVGRLTGQGVRGGSLLATLTVLGAAPAPFQKAITRAYMGPEGVTVAMRSGLLVYFGDAGRPHAKWISLARVLADPSSAGASYVDVRSPERPGAGLAGTASPTTNATTASNAEAASASEPVTAAQLAAGLTAALGGGSSSSTPTGAGEASGAATSTEAASPPAQTGAGASTETAPTATTERPAGSPAPGG